jgi:nucleoside-diphosphate-sugar epimerase
MSFWTGKRVLATGGAGFLGSFVVERLGNVGVPEEMIVVPRSRESDLRKWENCVAAVKDIDIVLHVAGKGGGIGANRATPADMFYDNAAMGVQLMEAARLEGERQARVAVQTPNLIKLMRQLWGGNDDPAIDAVYAACEPEAYQNARAAFEVDIAEYHRKNRPPSGSFASTAPMPPSSQPKSARKARR